MKTVNELLNISYKVREKKVKKEIKKIRKEIEQCAKCGKKGTIWYFDFPFDDGEISYIMNTFKAMGFEVIDELLHYRIKWG